MDNYKMLEKMYRDAEILIKNKICSEDPIFLIWYNECKNFLLNLFGSNNRFYKDFVNIDFKTNHRGLSPEASCKYGIDAAQLLFENISDYIESNGMLSNVKPFSTNKIFIVHGHDETLKLQVARLVEQQGIEAIILNEQANTGKTIIEKLEKYGDSVGAAIILFTPDDEGKEKSESNYKNRARQNVIFEAGYFIGYLGRNRIIHIVSDENIELPNDLSGVVYTKDSWQLKVIQELKEIGFNVDMNKVTI